MRRGARGPVLPILAALPLLASCLGGPAPGGPPSRSFIRHAFREDTTLGGAVRLAGECLVPRGVTLTILPGTVLAFVPEDEDGDGFGDARLRVDGRILALGEPASPVVFTSAGDDLGRRRAGDWEAILINFSRGNELRHVVIEHSRWSIHAHFTEAIVVGSLIRGNYEGCRLGNSRVDFRGNLIRGNVSKGLNFRNCANTVMGNEVTANGNGIFIYEKDAGTVISGNNIRGNERYDFRLDDFFRGEMVMRDNWWGSGDEKVVREKIYDARQDPDIGTVSLVLSPVPLPVADGFPPFVREALEGKP